MDETSIAKCLRCILPVGNLGEKLGVPAPDKLVLKYAMTGSAGEVESRF